MRKDMAKVIVERPRYDHGDGWSRPGRTRVIVDDDGEPLPAREPVRPRTKTKSLNENLSPLKRYLGAQVNRPWNKVFSEISENLKPTSTVQQHVRDHIDDFVATKTRMKAGKVVIAGRFRQEIPIEEDWRPYYVHPRTGLLKRNGRRRTAARWRAERAAAKAERATRLRELGPMLQAHLFGDVWWEVTLARIPRGQRYEDAVAAAKLSELTGEELYGRAGVYAIDKRVLSKAEKKKLGL